MLKKNVYQVYKNSLGEYTKVIFRGKALFTQTLEGEKNNFFGLTFEDAKQKLKDLSLVSTDKKFVSLGIGWTFE